MSKTKRTIILLLAFLFLATSVAFTVLVIVQMNQGDQTSSTADEELTQNNEGEDGMLAGTQLENFEPVESVAELEIIDLKEGEGEVVPEGATVTAHYTGAIATTGKIFQSSRDFGEPVPFSLDGVIEGWTEGVPGMKVGGIRRLVIPADKAYGAQSPSEEIPANSPLVFDIELVSIGEN